MNENPVEDCGLLGVGLWSEDQLAETLGALNYFVVPQLYFLEHLDRLGCVTAAS
jgi:hypothetical protein